LDRQKVNDHPQQMAEYLADGSVPHAIYDGQSLGDPDHKTATRRFAPVDKSDEGMQ
jgi:hypothetical protein